MYTKLELSLSYALSSAVMVFDILNMISSNVRGL